MTYRLPLLWAGFAALAGLAGADVLHLSGGGRIEGVLVRETLSSVTLDVGMGEVSLPRSRVARIELKESALTAYRRRLEAIDPVDARAYVLLARFAGQSGLRTESREVWARVLALDPANVEAHLALGHVLLDGRYVEEAEANRAMGFVHFEGRWMSPAEQASLLREREQGRADERRVEEARRAAREAEERARRAEDEAARARAAAPGPGNPPIWGYGAGVIVGSPYWGGYSAGCAGAACWTVPQVWPAPPPTPVATPLPRALPLRPSSMR
jgi:hypothetical protein